MRTGCVTCGHPQADHPRPGKCQTFSTMELPEGKTCGDCYAVNHCISLYGVKAANTFCDFWPIRFREATA